MDFDFLRFTLVGGFQSVLLLVAGHWFPWSRLFSWIRVIKDPLPILSRYVYGVVSIIIGFIIAIYHMNNPSVSETIVTIIAVVVMSGLSVFACYGIDKIGNDKDDFVGSNYKEAYDELRDGRD